MDLLLIVAGCLVANFLKFQTFSPDRNITIAILTALLVVLGVFRLLNLYKPMRVKTIGSELVQLCWRGFLVAMIMTLLAYLTKTGSVISREWAITSALISFCLLVLSRIIIRAFLRQLRKSGRNSRNVVIYGAGNLGKTVAEKLDSEKWTGLNVKGYCDDEVEKGKTIDGIPVLGGLQELTGMIEDGRAGRNGDIRIDHVWIALPLLATNRIREIMLELRQYPVQIHFVPDLAGADLLNYPMDQLAGIPIVNMSVARIVGPDAIIKTAFDKLFSLFALLIVWPLLVLIAILVKIGSEGPVLFKQRRYGVDGREMEVWKFRTMKVLEDGNVVKQATEYDPRVTPVGKFLRKWSLDELPQFINVLCGTMSVVGPRPHAVSHNEYYRDKIPLYMSRHLVKPGITGLAQVNGWRGETDEVYKMEKRVEYDLEYLRNWSIWLDITIVFRTVFATLFQKNVY